MFGRRRPSYEAQLDAEIRDHIERRIAAYITEGMQPEEARRRALIAFGATQKIKEECRELHFWNRAGLLLGDLKYTVRTLRKSPGFTVIGVLILALGIGSNVAVFSLIDSLFLRPLPVDRPGELSQIESIDEIGRRAGIPSQVMETLRKEPLLSGVCGFTTPRLTADINGGARSIGTLAMTGDCFTTLGVRIRIGRSFSLKDDNRTGERVVVLTDALWRSDFAASPSVLAARYKSTTRFSPSSAWPSPDSTDSCSAFLLAF